MPQSSDHGLSRRERQIMDILYQRGQASAADVLDGLTDPPSYSAVRALLRILEQKGHIRHRTDGARHIFAPVRPRGQEARTALRRVLDTFFGGSPERVVAALLEMPDAKVAPEELDRLSQLIKKAKEEGR
jgi:predicted transcriptional regulator